MYLTIYTEYIYTISTLCVSNYLLWMYLTMYLHWMYLPTQEAAAPCRSAVFPCHSQVLWRPVQEAASQVTTLDTVTIVNNITLSLQVFWAEWVSRHLLAAQEASLLTVPDWQGDKKIFTTLLQMTKDFNFRLMITWMQMYDLLCVLLGVDTNTSTSDMYL